MPQSNIVKRGPGQPTKYPSNAVELVDKYLEEIKKDKDAMPQVEDLALDVFHVLPDQLYKWGNKQNSFLQAIKKVKAAQLRFLHQRLTGRFNPAGPIWLTKILHGYKDTTDDSKQIRVIIDTLPLKSKVAVEEAEVVKEGENKKLEATSVAQS